MSRRGVPVVQAFNHTDEIVFPAAGSSSGTDVRMVRAKVPSGWLVWPRRVGAHAMFFVPDRRHEWKPQLLERGAPDRIRDGKSTWEEEVAAMAQLEKQEPYLRTPQAFARLLNEIQNERRAGGRGEERFRESQSG